MQTPVCVLFFMERLDRYFDNAATTPVHPSVVQAITSALANDIGNSSSIHSQGRKAAHLVDVAREHVANLIGGSPEEIVFTSGATESNNWLLRAFDSVAVSSIEHSSLWEAAHYLGATVIELDAEEQTDIDVFSLMRVNNETGLIYPFPAESGFPVHSRLTHSDITQAAGKIPVNLQDSSVDFASLSAHKFYGPKGIGALWARDANFPDPLLYGGSQENGFRSGTLNVPGIVGMGEAAKIAFETLEEQKILAEELTSIIVEELGVANLIPLDSVAVGRSPYILSFGFEDVLGEALVVELDARGFAISSGAACSSRSNEPSHVLTAMRIPDRKIRGAIRISVGRTNTRETAYELGLSIQESIKCLRKLRD